ncbi:MAG: hypothetical protein AAB664_02615 [Patescibacteria group bacterium]
MFQALRRFFISLGNQLFARHLLIENDEDDTSNVIDLVCKKDVSESSDTETDMASLGKLLPFKTKAQREFDRIAQEQREQQEQRCSRRAVRSDAVQKGKMILLSKRDPRLSQCCEEFFYEQPVLAEYLLSKIVSANGSLQVLRLTCLHLTKAFPKIEADVSSEMMKRMSVEADLEKTVDLASRHWGIGGDKIQARTKDLVFELQGDPIPEKKVPRGKWLMKERVCVSLDDLDIYARIFICAYVMLLASKEETRKRKITAA